jgi:hypothetical protein
MENSEESTNERENHDVVIDFLRLISVATTTLSQIDDEDQHMTDGSDQSAAHFMDMIARHLLSACNPQVLASGVSNLPKLTTDDDDKPTTDQEDHEENIKVYQYRRTDYLRRLLRAIAAISMDVAANVCSIVVSSQKTLPSVNQASFILLSHWLPVAPHLTPMATDLLKTLVSRCRSLPQYMFLLHETRRNRNYSTPVGLVICI